MRANSPLFDSEIQRRAIGTPFYRYSFADPLFTLIPLAEAFVWQVQAIDRLTRRSIVDVERSQSEIYVLYCQRENGLLSNRTQNKNITSAKMNYLLESNYLSNRENTPEREDVSNDQTNIKHNNLAISANNSDFESMKSTSDIRWDRESQSDSENLMAHDTVMTSEETPSRAYNSLLPEFQINVNFQDSSSLYRKWDAGLFVLWDPILFGSRTSSVSVYLSLDSATFQQNFNQIGISPWIGNHFRPHFGFFNTDFSNREIYGFPAIAFANNRLLGNNLGFKNQFTDWIHSGGFDIEFDWFRFKLFSGEMKRPVFANSETIYQGNYQRIANGLSLSFGEGNND
jgi:hypothetical protein